MKFGMVQYKSAQLVWAQVQRGMDCVSANTRYEKILCKGPSLYIQLEFPGLKGINQTQ